MEKWKDVKIEGIARIEKVVAEFDVMELQKTPYGKFKVKIYESQDGEFIGYTNLRVKDKTGDACGGVGHGNTIEEALKDTIEYFLKVLSDKDFWEEEDFECADAFDF
ncbi:hypothetical protein NL50_12755 [Clostridium acetobutylicum]|nr:hypothetical protein NL50_12755 [Clostridium acetobutylicum]